MKLTNSRNVTSTFGATFEKKNFSADVTGKTFDLIFNQLYEHKVKSIIRELMTNALDSHVDAGIGDRPFYVQLPTVLDPAFSVRDYGTSMGHDFVMELYTRAFYSPKTDGENADDFVGAFGLGSKTPYAYVDAYTIVTWLEGVKRTYLAAREDDGMPTITFLGEEPSDEPRGVQISFPVQSHHFEEFKRELLEVAKGFDVKPTTPGVHFPEETPLLSGDNWKVVPTTYESVLIRQGCVLYPFYYSDIRSELQQGFGIQVDVPIGTAQVAMNRESLSLDDKTRDDVTTYIALALDEMQSALREQIEDAADLFEANERWLELSRQFKIADAEYHGQKVDGVIRFRCKEKTTTPQEVSNFQQKPVASATLKFKVPEVRRLRFLIDRSGVTIPRKRARFWEYRRNLLYPQQLYILKDPTAKQLNALVRRLHLSRGQIVSWASLPDVAIVRKPRVTRDGGIAGVYSLDTREQVTELPDDFLWLPIERVNAASWSFGRENGGTFYSADSAYSHMNGVARMIGRPTVLLFTPSAMKRVELAEDKNLFNAARVWVQDHQEEMREDLLLRRAYGGLDYRTKDLAEELLGEYFPEQTDWSYAAVGSYSDDSLPRAFGFVPDIDGKLGEIFEELREKYPLIFSNDVDAMRDYISLRNSASLQGVTNPTTTQSATL